MTIRKTGELKVDMACMFLYSRPVQTSKLVYIVRVSQ